MLGNISTSQSSIACAGDAGLKFSGMLLYRAFHLRASIDKSSGDGRSSLYSWTITLRLASWKQRTDGTRPSIDGAMMADFEKRSSRAVSIAYHMHRTTRERAQVHAGSRVNVLWPPTRCGTKQCPVTAARP